MAANEEHHAPMHRLMRSVFDQIDRDHSGELNVRELIIAIRKHPNIADYFHLPTKIRQEDGSRESFEQVFQRIDTSNTRTISWEEFSAYFQHEEELAEKAEHDEKASVAAQMLHEEEESAAAAEALLSKEPEPQPLDAEEDTEPQRWYRYKHLGRAYYWEETTEATQLAPPSGVDPADIEDEETHEDEYEDFEAAYAGLLHLQRQGQEQEAIRARQDTADKEAARWTPKKALKLLMSPGQWRAPKLDPELTQEDWQDIKAEVARAAHEEGEHLFALERWEQASEAFKRALEAAPWAAEVAGWHTWRGECACMLFQTHGAFESFNAAVEVDPTLALHWANRARSLLDLAVQSGSAFSADKAVHDLEKALEIEGVVEEAERDSAVIEEYGGMLEAARAQAGMEQATPRLDDDGQGGQELLNSQGEVMAPIAMAAQAEMMMHQGDVLLHQGEFEDAAEMHRRARLLAEVTDGDMAKQAEYEQMRAQALESFGLTATDPSLHPTTSQNVDSPEKQLHPGLRPLSAAAKAKKKVQGDRVVQSIAHLRPHLMTYTGPLQLNTRSQLRASLRPSHHHGTIMAPLAAAKDVAVPMPPSRSLQPKARISVLHKHRYSTEMNAFREQHRAGSLLDSGLVDLHRHEDPLHALTPQERKEMRRSLFGDDDEDDLACIL